MIFEMFKSALAPAQFFAQSKTKMKEEGQPRQSSLDQQEDIDADLSFCFEMLASVSRSFSAVICQLPDGMKESVCLFYLVLRALDTVEDDMDFPEEKKIPLLQSFYTKCWDESFSMNGVGDTPEYRRLMKNFPKVVRAFKGQEDYAQATIEEITKRMGNGMAEFIQKEVDTIADFDRYCHYVAGLVGIGLSRLFADSGLEKPELREMEDLSNAIGMTLQKTNIIRDYHEDMHAGRVFLPKEIWGKYESTIEAFEQNFDKPSSIDCLNELLNNALLHVADSLTYLSRLENERIFKFTAIPQVMALATLEKLYGNKEVFRSNVKISKIVATKLITQTRTIEDAKAFFTEFMRKIAAKANTDNKIHQQTQEIVRQSLKVIGRS